MSATVNPSVARLSLVSRERLETLLELSQAFNSTIDVDSLLPRILELTLSVTESEAGSLWVVDHDRVRCIHAAGPAAPRLRGREQPGDIGVIGEALTTRRSVLVANALDDERFSIYHDAATGFRTRSAITIPLMAVAEPLGVIQLVNDVGGKDEFEEDDVAFLELVADDAAAALRNARLFEAERRAHNLKALLEVSHEITATFDLERVLLSVVNLANRAVRFDRCVLALWDRDVLTVRAISGEQRVDAKSADVRELSRFLLWAAERSEPLFINDVNDAADAEAVRVHELFDRYLSASHARGLLVLPIADAEGELGRLLFEFGAPDVVDDWSREAAELLANEAALAIRNAQLYARVPFISWLEPLAQKRKALLELPGRTWLRYGVAATVLAVLLIAVRIPLRISATDAQVYAAVQRPARAGVGGTIEDLLVREGDAVIAGQPIAVLRNDPLLVRLGSAEGELRLAERQGMSADATGDAATAASARMRATQLRESIALLRRESELLRVVAPTSGIVLTPRLEERIGSYREAGEPILWIGDPDSAEVRLRVPQHAVAEIRENDRVRVRVAARPELGFDGRVRVVAPLAEVMNGEPHYTVRATLIDDGHVLRPGMSARARVLTRSRPLGYLLVRRPWRFIRMHLWW